MRNYFLQVIDFQYFTCCTCQSQELYLRKEYQFFDSKNVLLIETDGKKDIKKVTVWKDTEKASHQEFKLHLPPMKAK